MKKIKLKIGKLLLMIMMFMALSPAFAEASEMPQSGQLTIYNYDRNSQPVSGITYTLWRVDESGGYRPENAGEAREHLVSASERSVVTDAGGKAIFAGLETGIYYVEETDLGEYSDWAFFNDPFLVDMPMTNESGDGWISDIEVFLKNAYLQIDKFVGPSGAADYDFTDARKAKHRPVAAAEQFGWSILSYLPNGIGGTSGESYVVTDTLGDNFAYTPGTVKVYLVKTKDMPCVSGYQLTEDAEYQVNFDMAANQLKVSLSDAGIALINQRDQNETVKDCFLLIKYDCTLSDRAMQGQDLYSGAEVAYSKAVNPRSRSAEMRTIQAEVTDRPEVHTGQIKVLKLDSIEKKKLAGAEFGIAASEADAKAGTFLATGVSDEQGELVFAGLTYGQAGDDSSQNTTGSSYWLVETKAPKDFIALKGALEVTYQRQMDEQTGQYYFARVTVYNAPEAPQETLEEPTETEEPSESESTSESNSRSTDSTKKPDTPNTPGRSNTSTGTTGTARSVKTGDSSPILILTGAVLLSLSVLLLAMRRRKTTGN